jgi:hypothetical protein
MTVRRKVIPLWRILVWGILVWRILVAGSDQPHQKAYQSKSAEQHGPIAHVEREKTTICRNLHIREHDLLCRIAMDWPEWIGPV